jgi:serine/threonine protein kinase/tetratricopeptide (TPR) repeat protein
MTFPAVPVNFSGAIGSPMAPGVVENNPPDPFSVRPHMSERSIFVAALEKDDPAERAAYLDQACAGDPALRQRLERLLLAHQPADSFLEAPAAELGATAAAPPLTEGPETRIGAYKLLQQIGEGGMGTVFMAEQTEPVQRRVALKIIKPGMDSRQVIARFEAERQALALMDHVNIARVFDGGATEAGRPFFVMELVHGVPITTYCDEHRLTPGQRLELFVPVCQAVQHAHQKGIIHRDVKPSNVLVTLYDGKPVPKVIDFGVAKATEQKLTERTLFTQYGTMVGTLEYMSPEQAEMSALGVDTRSDIFSLGVLLYELLTGSTPLTHKRLKAAAYAEILRMIKEEEPPRPSTRLSDSGETLASISAQRHMEPAKLTKLVRGELDWIAMKCLEKDRNRRYETANGLAMDIQCYLHDEPVLACPPSSWYRLRKFGRRNKGPVLAASLILFVLVAGVIGTTGGLIVAERAWQAEAEQRVQAEQAQTREAERANSEAQAKQDAKAERDRAVEAEADTKAFADFLANYVLAATRPQGVQAGVGVNVTLAEALEKAEPKIEAVFRGRPKAEALARHEIGVTWRNLGRYPDAIRHLERALELRRRSLGPDAPETRNTMNSLAVAYQEDGRLDLALPLYEETLRLCQAQLGPDDPVTVSVLHNLGSGYQAAGKLDLAVPLLEEAYKRRAAKLGSDDPETLDSMHALANAYGAVDKLDLALPLHEEALKLRKVKLGLSHPLTLRSMNALATDYQAAGKLNLAIPLFEEAFKAQKTMLGPDHPDTLSTQANLAEGYRAAGKLDLALPLLEQTLKQRQTKLGLDHHETLLSMNNLAQGYRDTGTLERAALLLEETVKLMKAKLGVNHPDTLIAMYNLASVYKAAGQFDRAIPLFEETLAKQKEKLGPDHLYTLQCMNNLAGAYDATSRFDRAIPLFEETLAKFKEKFGPDNPGTLTVMNNLALTYVDAGQLDRAIPLFEATLAKQRTVLGPTHPHTLQSVNNLARAYQSVSPPHPEMAAKAEPLYRELLADAQKRFQPDDPRTAGALADLGANLLRQQKWTEAEAALRESLAIREKKVPDDWRTFATKSMLGGALLGQKKYSEAEPLLLAGYLGMKQHATEIPQRFRSERLTESLERLVQFYDASGKPDEAAKWRKELDTQKQAERKPAKTKDKQASVSSHQSRTTD